MVQIDPDKNKAGLESQLVEKDRTQVRCIRQIVFTNYAWDRDAQPASPDIPTGNNTMLPPGRTDIETLFCRWKYIRVMAKKGRQEQEVEACFRLLHANEIENMVQLTAGDMRRFFRDGHDTPRGGRHVTKSFNDDNYTTSFDRKYTTGDAFCGAGGLSKGAMDAGFKVQWGFDSHEPVIITYRANHGPLGTKALNVRDQEFIELIQEEPGSYQVDHIHFSPPCQPFSPANTTGSEENNFRNSLPMFGICEILKKLKPRVSTIEETQGLSGRHQDWLYTLICDFSRIGYSVRWKAMEAKYYGVAQHRRRLLFNMAAPGDKVARFPDPTHGEAPDLQPFNKIKIIQNIPRWVSLQDTMTQPRQPETIPVQPHKWDELAFCVTTNGGQNNYHPDGGRNFTIRETARLQSFPDNYEFMGNMGNLKTMVGNAVPPALAKTWLRAVLKSLKETDDEERTSSSERGL